MNRLDKEIVERSLAPTRAKAQELIKSGNIKINGKVVTKSSLDILPSDNIEIVDTSTLKYVSRAGLKLEKAINTFSLDFSGKNIMDIGSSTGGFTDCAIKNEANKVIAVDVRIARHDGCVIVVCGIFIFVTKEVIVICEPKVTA